MNPVILPIYVNPKSKYVLVAAPSKPNSVIPSPPPGINFARNLLFIGRKKQILRTCAPEEVLLGDGLRMTIFRGRLNAFSVQAASLPPLAASSPSARRYSCGNILTNLLRYCAQPSSTFFACALPVYLACHLYLY